jgi:hypothetical protein
VKKFRPRVDWHELNAALVLLQTTVKINLPDPRHAGFHSHAYVQIEINIDYAETVRDLLRSHRLNFRYTRMKHVGASRWAWFAAHKNQFVNLFNPKG